MVLERLEVRNVGTSIFVFSGGEMELEEAKIISLKQKGTSQVPGLSKTLQVLTREESHSRCVCQCYSCGVRAKWRSRCCF